MMTPGVCSATAGDERRTLAIQMAAYHARVGVDKTHNNAAATPDTPAVIKHVVMDTPSMHNVAAAAADVIGFHGDAIDEPGEDRSLLATHSMTDDNRRRYDAQLDLHTV